MEISDSQARLIRDCVTDLVLRRQRYGQPIPSSVRDLLAALSSGGGTGHGDVGADSDLGCDDLINTTQAAAILGCSPRWVRKIANDLDGWKTQKGNGHHVFHRRTVLQYADARSTP